MGEYDMYDSLVVAELKQMYEENKQLKKEVETWKQRAYKLRQLSPLTQQPGEWI